MESHRRMVKNLHQDFLASREKYDAAVNYWRLLCRNILETKGQIGAWQPWLGIHKDPLNALVEEGSIYSMFSPTRKRGINIEQYLPKSTAVEISAKIGNFGEGTLEIPIQYLTICCALSEESAGIARQLIESWVNEEGTVSHAHGLIDRLIH
jgi:hypothetical protein